MASNSPPLPDLHGQRHGYTVQLTTTRHVPGAASDPPTASPPTVSVTRITYARSPGNAPRLISVQRTSVRPLTNTERFYLDRVARPVPTRTRSSPPSLEKRSLGQRKHKSSLWDQLKHCKHSTTRVLKNYKLSTTRMLHRGRSAVREGSNRVQAAFGNAPAAFKNAAAKWGTVALASAVAVGVAYAATNSIAYNTQPQPAYLTQWAREPTWLYADSPDQILGLHAPLWSRALQPEPVVEKHFKRMNKYWAPDKARLHKVSDTDMKKIYNRYVHAKENYHRRPPYMELGSERWGDDFNMTIPGDDLPHFQPGCVCTMTLALSNQLSHALTPYPYHDPIPANATDLASYCPCSIAAAAWRLKQGYSAEFLPPLVWEFYGTADDLKRRWDMGSMWLYDQYIRKATSEEVQRAKKGGWMKEYVSVQARRAHEWSENLRKDEDDDLYTDEYEGWSMNDFEL